MTLLATFNRRVGGFLGSSRQGSARVARERLLFHLRQADCSHHAPEKHPLSRGGGERAGAEMTPADLLHALLVRDVSW